MLHAGLAENRSARNLTIPSPAHHVIDMSEANPSEPEKTRPKDHTAVRPKTSDADGDAAQDQRLRRRTMRVDRRKFSTGAAVRLQAHLEITPDINGVPSLLALKTEPLTIGRNRDCGLCLPLENVSRQHARVYFFNDEYHIADKIGRAHV